MKIAMISGSWPPDVCGVGDGAELLSQHLENIGVSVSKISDSKWNWQNRKNIEIKIRNSNPDIIHIQYPSYGYGSSRIPAWLLYACRDIPIVITLHEYTAQVGKPLLKVIPRGMPYYLPFSFSDHIFFSNDYDKEKLSKIFPWVAKKSSVLSIASNIKAGTASNKSNSIVYFGQICPKKGLESFIDLAKNIKNENLGLKTIIIGAIPKGSKEWADHYLSLACKYNCHILEGLPSDDVSNALASSTFAYLPFPDGASSKRASLLACMVNGLVTLTTHTEFTPQWIKDVTINTTDAINAFDELKKLMHNNILIDQLSEKSKIATSSRNWDNFAKSHIDVYLDICSKHKAKK